MTDLNKERELELFNAFVEKNLPELFEKHTNGNYFAKVTYHSMFGAWLGAKAQAVPVWISTDFMLPNEGEAVLFIDKNNVIHDGYLNTDYVDGPYGENGEDFGDDQTLWASNSNGDEFLPSEIKSWMHRPSSPSASESGAEG